MARRRHSRRSHRMHGLGVLGSEPMSWGSLAVGALVGYALAKLMESKSSAPVSGFGALGAKRDDVRCEYCLRANPRNPGKCMALCK